MANVVIKRLEISRFRGIRHLEWYPSASMNVILGGGDVGKTTVLDAVALLLSPTNSSVISESDYWRREAADGFSIEAVISLPDDAEINTQRTLNWPWHWDGKTPVQPPQTVDGDDMPTAGDPVYWVRVRGTAELELVWEIVQPHGQIDHFPVAVRRRVGLVRLPAEDRNDRDLRLVYGSALDRLFADTTLRARIAQTVAGLNLDEPIGEQSGDKLSTCRRSRPSARSR